MSDVWCAWLMVETGKSFFIDSDVPYDCRFPSQKNPQTNIVIGFDGINPRSRCLIVEN
jgi:hypothetical protein